jgi:hypothetical protein
VHPDVGDIQLSYQTSKHADLQSLADATKKAGTVDRVVGAVNDIVALPQDAAVLFSDCGRVDTYYDSGAPGIVVCHEMLGYFRDLFRKRGVRDDALTKAVVGAALFGFLHELGHALVDLLQLPVTGKEEDAVDQLAAIILIESGSEGLNIALDGAEALLLHSKGTSFEKTQFWDQHSFEEQRYYALLCLVYGSNPKAYADLVQRRGLPADRAAACPAEYDRLRQAWQRLLEPYGK